MFGKQRAESVRTLLPQPEKGRLWFQRPLCRVTIAGSTHPSGRCVCRGICAAWRPGEAHPGKHHPITAGPPLLPCSHRLAIPFSAARTHSWVDGSEGGGAVPGALLEPRGRQAGVSAPRACATAQRPCAQLARELPRGVSCAWRGCLLVSGSRVGCHRVEESSFLKEDYGVW